MPLARPESNPSAQADRMHAASYITSEVMDRRLAPGKFAA